MYVGSLSSFILSRFRLNSPNTGMVKKNAVYYDKTQHAIKKRKEKKKRKFNLTTCELYLKKINNLQTHKRFKRTLFIMTKHNKPNFAVSPSFKLQNNT